MGWFKRAVRWAALVPFVVMAGLLAVIPSAPGSAGVAGGLVGAPGGPYAVGGDDVAFSPNGRWLATGGEGLSLLRVNQETGGVRRVAHVLFPVPADPYAVSFSPDGTFLATASAAPSPEGSLDVNDQLSVFKVDAHTGALRKVAAMSAGYEIGNVAFDPTGSFLAIPGTCGVQMFAFNRRTGTVRTLPHSSYPSGDTCASYVSFNPAGSLLAITQGEGDAIWLYAVNRRTGRLRKTAEWSDGSQSEAAEVTFSPDGRLLAVPFSDKCGVAVLSVTNGHRVEKVPGSPFLTDACPSLVAFSPDGRLIATLIVPDPEKIALGSFDEQTGAIQIPLGSPVRTGGQSPQALAFSPNGKFLVVGNGVDYGHETVKVFLVPSACADPDGDNDCDR